MHCKFCGLAMLNFDEIIKCPDPNCKGFKEIKTINEKINLLTFAITEGQLLQQLPNESNKEYALRRIRRTVQTLEFKNDPNEKIN